MLQDQVSQSIGNCFDLRYNNLHENKVHKNVQDILGRYLDQKNILKDVKELGVVEKIIAESNILESPEEIHYCC